MREFEASSNEFGKPTDFDSLDDGRKHDVYVSPLSLPVSLSLISPTLVRRSSKLISRLVEPSSLLLPPILRPPASLLPLFITVSFNVSPSSGSSLISPTSTIFGTSTLSAETLSPPSTTSSPRTSTYIAPSKRTWTRKISGASSSRTVRRMSGRGPRSRFGRSMRRRRY
jgi:hypothetical protein